MSTRIAGPILARSSGVVSLFVLNVFLARVLESSSLGIYFLLHAGALLMSVPISSGIGMLMLRDASKDRVDGGAVPSRQMLRVVWRTITSNAAIVVTAVVPVVVVAGVVVEGLNGVARHSWALPGPALGLAVVQVMGDYLKAKGRPSVANFIQSGAIPVAQLAASLVLAPKLGLVGVLWSWVGASFIGGMIAGMVAWRAAGGNSVGPQTSLSGYDSVRRVRRTARPFLGITALGVLYNRQDTLILGLFVSSDKVASYGVALRLVGVLRLMLVAINSVFAPAIARANRSGRRSLTIVARRAMGASAAVALIVSVPMAIVSTHLLGLFGDHFKSDVGLFLILLIGATINLGAGPVGYLLTMTGRHLIFFRIQGGFVFANLVLNFILVPWLGEFGAAIANSLTLVGLNLVVLVTVLRWLRPSPLGGY